MLIFQLFYDVTATDPDGKIHLLIQLLEQMLGFITIDADDGEIRLKSSADFETKNSYNFNVIATDTDGKQDTESITVNVTNANDQPIVTSGSAPATLVENLSNSTVLYYNFN